MAAREAPRRHRVDQARRRGPRLGKKMCKQKGTGQARQGSRQRSALRRRRLGLRAQAARLRVHDAAQGQEGRAALARSRCARGAEDRRRSTASTPTARPSRSPTALAALGGRQQGADRRRQDEREPRARRAEPARQPVARARGPQRLRHPPPRDAGPHAGRGAGRDRARSSRSEESVMRSAAVHHQAPAPHREERAPARDRRRCHAHAEGEAYAQKVVFEVARDANKIEIRSAVETLFKVTVTDVRTLVVRGKDKRVGRFAGRRPAWKKAFVTLEGRRQHRVLRGSLSHGDHESTSRPRPAVAACPRRTSARSPRASRRRACSSTRLRQVGRNNYGRITSRFRGGGHKQRYRVIDFKRNKTGVPATVLGDRVRPEPHRAHRAHPVHRRREGLHPRAADRLGVGDEVISANTRRHQAGQLAAAALHPDRHRRSTPSSSRSARGAQLGRSAGTQGHADGEGRRLGARCACRRARCAACTSSCRATIGAIGNSEHAQHPVGQGRPQALAGHPPAQPRRVDEPRRSPDGWWRGPQLRWSSPVHARGASRPRASRPVTTSGPSSSSSAAARAKE